MPTYTFENTENGDVFELTMRISERDEYVKYNPKMKQLITGAPMMVSSTGGMKNDDGWKENMSRIAEAHPGTPFAERYGKRNTKDIKTQEVLNKHRKKWTSE
jgi:predicted nucleic acid-binding Zn ribbon protein